MPGLWHLRQDQGKMRPMFANTFNAHSVSPAGEAMGVARVGKSKKPRLI